MINVLKKAIMDKQNQYANVGITIRQVGIGDGVQFTSLPENFYHTHGFKLIDISKPWYFDYNPYVRRDVPYDRSIELWNYPKNYEWPKIRSSVYMNNAEIHASLFEIKEPTLTRPRLYHFEKYIEVPERQMILFHPYGKSHGALPDYVINHIVNKYKDYPYFYQIGAKDDPKVKGIYFYETPRIWDLAYVLSKARMLIGVDSGPAWIAACYPDVQIKKIRIKFQYGYCEPKDWVPMDVNNPHAFWDDLTLFQIYNCFEHSAGFTRSFREI